MLPPARKTVYVHAALEPAAPQNGRGLAIPVVSVPVTPVPHQLPLQIVAQEQTGEHFLYSKILESYRTQDSASLQKTLQLLLKTYADSVFADNAMYLAGLLSIEQNDLPRARYYFDRLVKQFPHGNKVVAALFATAVVEKKSRNFARSRIFFERVARLFPGSPEAGRVQVELKLLKSEEQQNGRGA
jgi:TolA-binding protein